MSSTDDINTICMDCSKDCDVWEEVEVGNPGGKTEIWCYCKDCDTQTFHPLPPNT